MLAGALITFVSMRCMSAATHGKIFSGFAYISALVQTLTFLVVKSTNELKEVKWGRAQSRTTLKNIVDRQHHALWIRFVVGIISSIVIRVVASFVDGEASTNRVVIMLGWGLSFVVLVFIVVSASDYWRVTKLKSEFEVLQSQAEKRRDELAALRKMDKAP